MQRIQEPTQRVGAIIPKQDLEKLLAKLKANKIRFSDWLREQIKKEAN
jgi:hypothetical protein